MFTDMVGYTALTQSSESQALEVLERHDRLLRAFFPKYHGREVKAIGDSFMVEFDSALDAPKRAAEISRELNVGTLLEGSVRKAGNRVRVSVQLIDANNDRHLWAENFDRNLEDVFAIQSEIAQNVAATLKIRLLERDVERLKRAPTNDPVAHELVLKGRSYYQFASEKDSMIAIGYFEQAIQRDPRYVVPYVWLAAVYENLAFHEIMPLKDAMPKVEELCKKALELDESNSAAHVVMSGVMEYHMDFAGQAEEIRRALELDPNSSIAHNSEADLCMVRKQFEKAHLESQRALELDPLSATTISHAATHYLYSGELGKAIELYEKVLSVEPDNSFAIGNLGICHLRQGMFDLAVEEVKKSIEMEGGGSPNSLADLPYVLSKAGRTDEAKKVVSDLVKHYEERGSGAASVARGYAAIGDKDEAFKWMERAYEEHSPLLRSFVVDFNFEGMHLDPRFKAFIKKLGLESG